MDKKFLILESENIPLSNTTNMTKKLHPSTISRRAKGQIVPREQYIENCGLLSKAQEIALVEFIQDLIEIGLVPKVHDIPKYVKGLFDKKPGKNWPTRFVHKHSLVLNEHTSKLTPPKSRTSNQYLSPKSETELSKYRKFNRKFKKVLDDLVNHNGQKLRKACQRLQEQIMALEKQKKELRKALIAEKKKNEQSDQLFEELGSDDDKLAPFLSIENISEAYELQNQTQEIEDELEDESKDDSEDKSEDEEAKDKLEEATIRKHQEQLKKMRIEEEKAASRRKVAARAQEKKKEIPHRKVVNGVQRKATITQFPTNLQLSKEQKAVNQTRSRKQKIPQHGAKDGNLNVRADELMSMVSSMQTSRSGRQLRKPRRYEFS